MLCFQTTAATLVDLIINHPDVRPTVERGDHKLSSLELLTDHRNICYAGEGGCALFIWKGEGTYEGHVFLLPGSRGASGLAFGKCALEALFARENVRRVISDVPLELPAARMYVRRLGFYSKGRHPELPVEMFVLETPDGAFVQ